MTQTDNLAAELAARMPQPSSAAPTMLAAAGADVAGELQQDPPAEGFNPEIHETGADGRPVMRADGRTFKLKRGRGSPSRRIHATAPPPGFATADGAAPAPFADAGAGADVEPIAVKAKRCAKDSADTFFSLAVAFLSAEWEPEPAERERIETALERVYLRYGSLDLPPGLALVLAVTMYAAKRQLVAQLLAPIVARVFGGGAAGDGLTSGLTEPGVLRNAA
jgi:hypothetical protein